MCRSNWMYADFIIFTIISLKPFDFVYVVFSVSDKNKTFEFGFCCDCRPFSLASGCRRFVPIPTRFPMMLRLARYVNVTLCFFVNFVI